MPSVQQYTRGVPKLAEHTGEYRGQHKGVQPTVGTEPLHTRGGSDASGGVDRENCGVGEAEQ